MSELLDQLLAAVELKEVRRAGWVLRAIEDAESVAAHSWGISMLVVALLPDDLDLSRALAYAALHDLAEVRTGDLTPADGVSSSEKLERETAAMQTIVCRTARTRLSALAGVRVPGGR